MNLFQKVSLGVLTISCVCSLATANDTKNDGGVFIGVDAAALMQKAKTLTSTQNQTGTQKDSFSDSDLVGDFGLKVGYYFNPNHRLYASYHYNTYANTDALSVLPFGSIGNTLLNHIDASYNAHKFAIGYDFLPYITDSSKAVFGVYAGYGIVNAKYSVVTSVNGTSGIKGVPLDPSSWSDNVGAFLAGINIGYLYELGFGDLEFGVKVEYLQSQKASKDIVSKITTSTTTISTQKGYASSISAGIYAGYSYKF